MLLRLGGEVGGGERASHPRVYPSQGDWGPEEGVSVDIAPCSELRRGCCQLAADVGGRVMRAHAPLGTPLSRSFIQLAASTACVT